jgi:prevent-host-death family protein
MKRQSISVSEFKSKSLGLFERVFKTGETIVVTKRGEPIAQVVPYSRDGEKLIPGRLEGTIVEEDDIVTPLGAKMWKASK